MAIDVELQERLNKIDKIRDELKKAEKSASKEIMDMLKELMGSNPLLEGMRWNQYTPHFNDGDVCEFGVNGPEFKFNENLFPIEDDTERDAYGSYHNGEGWYDSYTVDDEFFDKRADILNHKEIASLKKTVKDVDDVFSKLTDMESQLQAMFGDGIQVTVTADGVETEDYDHD